MQSSAVACVNVAFVAPLKFASGSPVVPQITSSWSWISDHGRSRAARKNAADRRSNISINRGSVVLT
jgi:hypothetical protein